MMEERSWSTVSEYTLAVITTLLLPLSAGLYLVPLHGLFQTGFQHKDQSMLWYEHDNMPSGMFALHHRKNAQ